MKWQERLWEKKKQSVLFSFPELWFGILRKQHVGVSPWEEAAVIKAKTEECTGEGQAELVSLWGRAAGSWLCSDSMVKTQLRNTEAKGSLKVSDESIFQQKT